MGLINIYNSVSNEHSSFKGNGKLRDLLPEYDFKHCLILKSGDRIDENYEVTEEDVLYLRAVPGSVSTVMLVGLVFAVVLAGYSIGVAYKNNKQLKELMENAQKKGSNANTATEQLPFIRGCKNKTALGNAVQYVIGETYNSPYLLTDGYYSLEGVDGKKQYWTTVLSAGNAKQIIKELYCGNEKIKTFTETSPQNESYSTDSNSIYYDADNIIEITQTGEFQNNWFRQKVVSSYVGSEIKNDYSDERDSKKEYLIKQCEMNTQKVEVGIEFPVLRRINDDGDYVSYGVTVTPEWSNGETDSEGNIIWNEFTFACQSSSWVLADTEKKAELLAEGKIERSEYGLYYSKSDDVKIKGNPAAPQIYYYAENAGNYINRNSNATIRFLAAKEFTAEEAYGKTISIRLSRSMKSKSSTQEDVYMSFMNCFCYDNQKSTSSKLEPCVTYTGGNNLTMIGIHFVANGSTEGLLDEFNIVSHGMAKKITADGFGEYEATRNPVSWIAEILTSGTHKHSQYEESELYMSSWYNAWSYCETNGLHVDGIVTQNIKKRELLNKLLYVINATIIINADGLLEIAIDKAEETPVALLNAECIKSVSYAKEFNRKPDGMKLTFTNKNSWQVDTRYVMKDGENSHSVDDVIIEKNVEFVTEPDFIYKIGNRALKELALQPLTITADIGREGDYYPLYSLVLVQLPQLHQGLASSTIKKVIKNSNGATVKIEISDLVQFDSTSRYGVVIQNGTTIRYKEVTGSGATRELTFVEPITSYSLNVGDTLSFGYLNWAGTFDKVTNKMKIYGISRGDNGGVKLTLKPYNASIYTVGSIPEYKSNLTKPVQPQRAPEALTQQDLTKAFETTRTIKSIVVYYAVTETSASPDKSSFSSTVPTMTSEKRYLWTYTRTNFQDGSYSDTSIVLNGAYGEQGLPGTGYILDISPDSTTVYADGAGAVTVEAVQFGAYLFYDATDVSASTVFKAYINEVEVGTWSGNVVSIPTLNFTEDTTEVKIVATNGNAVRTGYATLTKVYGNTIYQLMPSTQNIKVQQNGEIVPSLVTVTRQKITSTGYYQAGEDEGVIYGRALPGGTLQKIGYNKVASSESYSADKQYCTEFEPFMLGVSVESGSGTDIVIGDENNNAIIFYTRKEA